MVWIRFSCPIGVFVPQASPCNIDENYPPTHTHAYLKARTNCHNTARHLDSCVRSVVIRCKRKGDVFRFCFPYSRSLFTGQESQESPFGFWVRRRSALAGRGSYHQKKNRSKAFWSVCWCVSSQSSNVSRIRRRTVQVFLLPVIIDHSGVWLSASAISGISVSQ